MILQEYYTKMEENTSFSSDVSSDKIKMLSVAKEVLRDMYLKLSLEATQCSSSFETEEGVAEYVIHPRILDIINMRVDGQRLDFKTRKVYERDPEDSTSSGKPGTYVPMAKIRATAQLTENSKLTVVSTSALDTSNVVLKGNDASGNFVSEVVVLTGTTGVESSNTFSRIESITKGSTTGTVTATAVINAGEEDEDTVTIISLLPTEFEKECWEVKLIPTPDDAYTITYSYNPVPWALSSDEEPIPLPDSYLDPFLNEATFRMLTRQGDEKAGQYKALGMASLTEVEDRDASSEERTLKFEFAELL